MYEDAEIKDCDKAGLLNNNKKVRTARAAAPGHLAQPASCRKTARWRQTACRLCKARRHGHTSEETILRALYAPGRFPCWRNGGRKLRTGTS